MKAAITILFLSLGFSHISLANTTCGKTAGFTYNQDTEKRAYRLSGFWLKQNTKDIRITYGNSPDLIDTVEQLEGSIFVCLDEYDIKERKYSGRKRLYAEATKFRVWVNGKLITPEKGNKKILYNLNEKRSVLDLKTDPNLEVWENSTLLDELCFKSDDVKKAHKQILNFEEQEVLFDFDTEFYVESWVEGNTIIVTAINGKLLDDGLTQEDATIEYVIEECTF